MSDFVDYFIVVTRRVKDSLQGLHEIVDSPFHEPSIKGMVAVATIIVGDVLNGLDDLVVKNLDLVYEITAIFDNVGHFMVKNHPELLVPKQKLDEHYEQGISEVVMNFRVRD